LYENGWFYTVCSLNNVGKLIRFGFRPNDEIKVYDNVGWGDDYGTGTTLTGFHASSKRADDAAGKFFVGGYAWAGNASYPAEWGTYDLAHNLFRADSGSPTASVCPAYSPQQLLTSVAGMALNSYFGIIVDKLVSWPTYVVGPPAYTCAQVECAIPGSYFPAFGGIAAMPYDSDTQELFFVGHDGTLTILKSPTGTYCTGHTSGTPSYPQGAPTDNSPRLIAAGTLNANGYTPIVGAFFADASPPTSFIVPWEPSQWLFD
jgi:hypothetical protein